MKRSHRRIVVALFYSATPLSSVQLFFVTGLWSGFLYPALARLEARGVLESRRRPDHGRLYALTLKGMGLAREMLP